MKVKRQSERTGGLGWGPGRSRGEAIGVGVRAALLFVLVGAAATGAGELIEKVVAVVDDQPILLGEVQARLAAELASLGIAPGDTAAVRQLRAQLLEGMIEQEVLFLEAQERGMRMPDEEVEGAVEEAIARNREALGSEQLFLLQLEREGITEEELRERFAEEARREILAGRLVQGELRGQVEVTPEEVRRYFEEHRAELPAREAAVDLQRIVLLVEPDSATQERTRALAAGVAGRIRAGELVFAEAARRYSDDPNGKQGGDLHRLQRGDLAGRLGEAFEQQVFALPVEEVSDPVLSPLGYHLLWVHEKAPDLQWVHLSHVLFGVPIVRADRVRAEERAAAVRAEALAGTPFEDLARRYSQTPEGVEGGRLGPIPERLLDEPLRAALEGLAPGAVSEVVPVEGAFLVLRLLDREVEREFNFEEIEEEMTEYVRTRRMEERYSAWIEELKENHYIERRSWE